MLVKSAVKIISTG
ncbi:hypothetical protein VCCP1047_3361, partial [Vibrio cholerae CP1047(20)]